MGTRPRKTSLKESTRRKGELRIAQQKALREEKAKKKTVSGMARNAAAPPPKRKSKKAKAKAKAKRVKTVGGVASLLRGRGRLPK